MANSANNVLAQWSECLNCSLRRWYIATIYLIDSIRGFFFFLFFILFSSESVLTSGANLSVPPRIAIHRDGQALGQGVET